MRIATWNVNSLTARLPRVEEWLAYAAARRPLHAGDQAGRRVVPPRGRSRSLGYETAHHGDGRWNGVAIASRVGLDQVATGLGSVDDEQGTRLIAADCGGVRVLSVYVPNGRSLDSEQYTGQAGLAGAAPRAPRGDHVSLVEGRGVRRLQRGTRGPRRVEPGGVRGRRPT